MTIHNNSDSKIGRTRPSQSNVIAVNQDQTFWTVAKSLLPEKLEFQRQDALTSVGVPADFKSYPSMGHAYCPEVRWRKKKKNEST